MSHTYIDTFSPPAPAVPRGAMLVELLMDLAGTLFRHSPPRKPTRTEEAAAVRELAMQVQNTDPSFAADLMCAAARHESLDDEAAVTRH